MSEPLPYDEIKFEKSFKVEAMLNTPDDSDVGNFVENDVGYPYKVKEKTKLFFFYP